MRLIIAEKPSLGRAIADVLPKPHKKHEGYIETAQGDYVTWCVGHLLEQAEPDQYDPAYKQWKLEHLPIVPQQWQLKPRKGVSKQLSVIRKLLKTADTIVHAGDPDREGQLLVDEVLDYLKLSATRRKKVRRLLVNDLNGPAVKEGIAATAGQRQFCSPFGFCSGPFPCGLAVRYQPYPGIHRTGPEIRLQRFAVCWPCSDTGTGSCGAAG